jgi:TM2 domain-containing membrane protein YozV
MPQEWFYARNGQQNGPVTIAEVREMAVSGRLRLADHVWREGMETWLVAGAVQDIFPPPAVPVHLAYAQPVAMPYSMLTSTSVSAAHALMRYEANKKSLVIAYLLWWFLGSFGAHRFYLGRNGTASAMLVLTIVSIPLIFVGIGLVTLLISGIWAFIDAFLIPGICRDFNNGLANSLAATGFAR